MLRRATFAVAVLVCSALLVFSGIGTASAQTTIANSKHDFSAGTTGSTVDLGFSSPCMACHVPHPKGVTSTYGLLWNRPDHAAPSWTMYDTTSLTAGNQGTTAPTGQDLLCLSCHDGTIALNSSGGATGTDGLIGTITPTNTGVDLNVTQNLSNDHPVSISYTVTLAGPKASEYQATPTGVKLFNNGTDDMVRCASCHNPHDGTGGATGKFLRVTADLLCQSCHAK